MEFFENIVDFYRKEIFTDLEISVFNGQEVSHACHCHKLVLVAAVPQLKDIFCDVQDSEDHSQIILENTDVSKVKEAIDGLYQSLLSGNFNPSRLGQIFSMSQAVPDFSDLQKELMQTRIEANLSLEKYLCVTIEDCGLENFDNLYLVQQRNGINFAAKVTKSGLTLIEILSRLFQVPLKSIFETDQSFNENGVQEELNSLPYKNIDHMKLESKIYFENISRIKDCAWIPVPIGKELMFQVVDLAEIEDNFHDLVQVSDSKMCSLFNKTEVMSMTDQNKVTHILQTVVKIMNFSSIQELYLQPVIKALVETHQTKLCRQEALKIFNSSQERKKMKENICKSEKIPTELKCPHEGCDKIFKKKAGYRKHVNYFHLKEGSGVPCEQCGIIYQNFFYLRIHKRQAHEHVNCKECNETFVGENELGRHRRKVHLTGTEHICEVCGQGFKMRFYMKRHKRCVLLISRVNYR